MSTTPNLGAHFAPVASKVAQISSAVQEKAERVRAKADAHYERHAKQWVSAQYTKMLLNEGTHQSPRPSGVVEDRKAHLFRAATHLVQRKQHLRLLRIEKAAQRMSGLDRDIGFER